MCKFGAVRIDRMQVSSREHMTAEHKQPGTSNTAHIVCLQNEGPPTFAAVFLHWHTIF